MKTLKLSRNNKATPIFKQQFYLYSIYRISISKFVQLSNKEYIRLYVSVHIRSREEDAKEAVSHWEELVVDSPNWNDV